jgi:tetratricopeptide (TPR) repeat protein
VPVDRDAILKKAEKLLRQGKLDGAIAEYVRLLEEQPKDWNSINALGDLYVRAGQVESGIAQFTQIADHLYGEGFLPRAAAVYKKILKLKADDEHALLRLADIATRQGVLVDAKTYYRHIAKRREAGGDRVGHAQIVVRLGELDPNDAGAKILGARAAHGINDTAKAVTLLTEAADALEKQKRVADALAALAEAVALDPSDASLRTRLLDGLLAQGELQRARLLARTAAEHVAVAGALDAAGSAAEALDALADAARLAPEDLALRTRVARASVAAGDLERARQFLTAEAAGDDPDLLNELARLELQSGRIDEGRRVLARLLELDPARRDAFMFVATDLADRGQVEGAFACVEVVAEAALRDEDWGGAAAALHEFVTRVPNQIPALIKLVEICVDGGLESTMFMAQSQLADAYLAAGRAAEARVIAEDLVAREPWLRANIERFRRALMMLGIADPDAVIAERLSGDSPFLSTVDVPAPGQDHTGAAGSVLLADGELPALSLELPEMPLAAEASAYDGGGDDAAVRAAEDVAAPVAVDAEPQIVAFDPPEIDLSDALSGLHAASPAAATGGSGSASLEEVFDDMRTRAVRESQLQNAQAQYGAGLEHASHGRLDHAIVAFEAAARVPMMRFPAGARLGRLHIARGDLQSGVEWLERASQAPPPTPDDGHAVLYELADALERLGESTRALAVLLELHADAGDYRDVTSRIDRLSRVQAP